MDSGCVGAGPEPAREELLDHGTVGVPGVAAFQMKRLAGGVLMRIQVLGQGLVGGGGYGPEQLRDMGTARGAPDQFGSALAEAGPDVQAHQLGVVAGNL